MTKTPTITIKAILRYPAGFEEESAIIKRTEGAPTRAQVQSVLDKACKAWSGHDDVSKSAAGQRVEGWDRASNLEILVQSWNRSGTTLVLTVTGFPAATEPVGLVEIADRLGVARQTVDSWRLRGSLPEPRWTVGGRPAWDWADIEAWAKSTGRA